METEPLTQLAIRAENLRLAARAREAGVSPARFEGWDDEGLAVFSNVVIS